MVRPSSSLPFFLANVASAYIAQRARAAIRIDDSAAIPSYQPLSPPGTPIALGAHGSRWWETPASPSDSRADLPELSEFIRGLVAQSNVQMPTLAATMCYMEKLKEKLPTVATGTCLYSFTDLA
jgi:hypothetical protein